MPTSVTLLPRVCWTSMHFEEETGANMAKKVMGRLGDMAWKPNFTECIRLHENMVLKRSER